MEGGEPVRGSCLIAGYDNANWFYVGTGMNKIVPDDQHGSELWLRLNDDNMTNGNGQVNAYVKVERRLPVINAIVS
jgi:hypothetical protein